MALRSEEYMNLKKMLINFIKKVTVALFLFCKKVKRDTTSICNMKSL